MFRYAFTSNGLAEKKPDAMLTGFTSPINLAFDDKHHLFVDDGFSQIREFAISAAGFGSLLGSLSVANYAGGFTVDRDGGVYAVVGQHNQTVNAYAPGATGNAQPTHQLQLPEPSAPNLQIDANGALFSLNVGSGIYEFVHPKIETNPDCFIAPLRPIEFDFFSVFNLTSDQHLLVRFFPNGLYSRWQDGDFVILNRLSDKTRFADHIYYAKDCYLPGQSPGPVTGIAIHDNIVFYACQYPRSAVYVYDLSTVRADRKITPAQALGLPLRAPEEIMVGP